MRPQAVSLLCVYLAVKPVGEPDAGDRHVRFDERGWETERCRMAQATAPILESTNQTFRLSIDVARLALRRSCQDLQVCGGSGVFAPRTKQSKPRRNA